MSWHQRSLRPSRTLSTTRPKSSVHPRAHKAPSPKSPQPKRRGRPHGSVSLTPDIERTILAYILSGAFDHAAAEAAGISVRTFREWMARGEGTNATRPCTPKLKRFAKAVRQAKAQVRIAAEMKLHKTNPAKWLKYVAPSTFEREGWTEPVSREQEQARQGDSFEDAVVAYRDRRGLPDDWDPLAPDPAGPLPAPKGDERP